MYFVWGRNLFGRVDQVPNVCHVATLCFHFMYIPFIQYDTVLVVYGQRRKESASAFPIRRSWKSVGFAYLRAFLVMVWLVSTAAFLDQLLNSAKYKEPSERVWFIVEVSLSVVATALFVLSYWMSGPSAERREYLLRVVAKAREREAAQTAAEAKTAPPVETPRPWQKASNSEQ